MNREEINHKMTKLREENPFISSRELAYQVLVDQIIRQELASGEHIVQDALAESMEISRSPVREALIRLEEEGFLVKGNKNSYIVAGIQLKDYVEYCDMRIRMESYAAELAVQNVSTEQLQWLKKNVVEYANTTDIVKARQLDTEFHEKIIMIANNPYIIDFHKRTEKKKLYYARYLVHTENIKAAVMDHKRIYEAIAAYDNKKANKAMKRHLQHYIDKLYDVM